MCLTTVAIPYALQTQIDDIRLSAASLMGGKQSFQNKLEQAKRESHCSWELLLVLGGTDPDLLAAKKHADRQCQQLRQALEHYSQIESFMPILDTLSPESLHQVALELQEHIDAVREIEHWLGEGSVGGVRSRLQFPFFAGSFQSSKNVEFDDHMRHSGLPP